MAIYHCSVKVGSRAKGQSAIAAAAYRAGEKLTDHETGLVSDYTKKGGVVYSEIALCKNAPAEYADRQTLWSAVHQIEKAKDARLWREIEVALPKEFSRADQIETVRDFVKRLTAQGMCADWSLHDKGDGNPHAHIMLTTRSITTDGTWAPKSRKVYDLDENGEKIFQKIDKTGRKQYKCHKEDYNNWNASERVEEWRAAWAECCNARLTEQNQIDHRSYARQGIDQQPTIHEGYTARKIAAAGHESDRVQRNAEIRERNRLLRALVGQIKAIGEKIQRFIDGKPHRYIKPLTEREHKYLWLDLQKADLLEWQVTERDGKPQLGYSEYDEELIQELRDDFARKEAYLEKNITINRKSESVEVSDVQKGCTYCLFDSNLPDKAGFIDSMRHTMGYLDFKLGEYDEALIAMITDRFCEEGISAEQRKRFLAKRSKKETDKIIWKQESIPKVTGTDLSAELKAKHAEEPPQARAAKQSGQRAAGSPVPEKQPLKSATTATTPKSPVSVDLKQIIALRDDYFRKALVFGYLETVHISTTAQESYASARKIAQEFYAAAKAYNDLMDRIGATLNPIKKLKLRSQLDDAAARLGLAAWQLNRKLGITLLCDGRQFDCATATKYETDTIAKRAHYHLDSKRDAAEAESKRNAMIRRLSDEKVTVDSVQDALAAFEGACKEVPEEQRQAVFSALCSAATPSFYEFEQSGYISKSRRQAKEHISRIVSAIKPVKPVVQQQEQSRSTLPNVQEPPIIYRGGMHR